MNTRPHRRKFRFVPSSCTDGDTVEGCLFATIRLYGVDAPEIDTPEGEAAREFSELWLRRFPKARAIPMEIDDYGRVVCRLVTSRGESLAQALVDSAGSLAVRAESVTVATWTPPRQLAALRQVGCGSRCGRICTSGPMGGHLSATT